MAVSFSPELRLAIACCRFPADDAAQRAVADAAAAVSDWPAFEWQVRRHRIPGLASAAVARAGEHVPADVRSRLAAEAQKAAILDIRQAAETARLQRVFDESGFPALFIKGATVGMLAYGGLGIKQSWDIDLLTTPECVAPAMKLLERNGYAAVQLAGFSDAALGRFARFSNEEHLRGANGIDLELHWRLFANPEILPGVTAVSESQAVLLGGQAVRTFGDDLLVPYLITHGHEHGWSRLKWLADLNALLQQCSADRIRRHFAQAEPLGVARGASVALLLCHDLLGLELPADLLERLRKDRFTGSLAATSLACIADTHGGSEGPKISKRNAALMASRFRRRPGWRNRIVEFRTLWTQPLLRAKFPAQLDFLYHIVRVPLFVIRLPLRLLPSRQLTPGKATKPPG